MDYKTFKDLAFNDHGFYKSDAIQAIQFFPNNYGVSVVGGFSGTKLIGLYGDGVDTFEVAVLRGTPENWTIHYTNSVACGDVRGFLTETEVSECMATIQQFPDLDTLPDYVPCGYLDRDED